MNNIVKHSFNYKLLQDLTAYIIPFQPQQLSDV
jgi:hypothetical protein